MTALQGHYHCFIESVCNQFCCSDAIKPLQEGFNALCESETKYNTDIDEWELMPAVLNYILANNPNFYIVGVSGNRNISSDGWYEVEYSIRNDDIPNFYLYLTTHYDHDPDFEDEWENRPDNTVEPSEIIWDDIDDYWKGFEHIMEDETVMKLLPANMVEQMRRCVTNGKSNK